MRREELKEEMSKEFDKHFKAIAENQTFHYSKPCFEPDEDGNIIIIFKSSFGPIEHISYGINKNGEYYFHWVFPEFWPADDELVTEDRIIDKAEMIRAIKNEINVCKKAGNEEMIKCYEDVLVRFGWT